MSQIQSNRGQSRRPRERGFAMIIGLVIVLVMTAFSSALVFTSAAHHVKAKNATERARALALAEGAVTLLLNDLDADAKGPIKDDTNYTLSGTTFVREYTPFDAGDGTVRVEVTYLVLVSGSYTPVAFASRAAPVELYDLQDDIGETMNLADKLPDKTGQLHSQLQAWREDVHAPMPMPTDNGG